MGVRDALRMVDSFNKWAQRNQERAKALDDFIHDGLIAAAKRCKTCLKDDLGLTFIEGEDHPLSDSVPSGYEATPAEDVAEEVSPPLADDEITIDSVGRSDAEEMEDISLDGPTREFSSDFELIEPSPLIVEASEPEPETEETVEEKPAFTWADYEDAVTPAKTEPVIEESEEEEPSFDSEDIEDLPIDEPISLGDPKVLSPSEKPAIPTSEFESSIGEEFAPPVYEEDEDPETSDPITEPPSPPPPPESEEDEEERRRRARRLFFGD